MWHRGAILIWEFPAEFLAAFSRVYILTFLLAFGVSMLRADFLLFFKTVPLSLRLIMSIPWLSALLTLSLPILAWQIWRDGRQPVMWKAHYLAVMFASVVFIWYVSYWNVMTGS